VKAECFDFVVIGSGFGGSIMSMVLRRLGKTVLLLERGSHPRFAIGESSTPFANLLMERLAEDYDLPFLRWLSEWGRWQEAFPTLPAGLKRGFTFYHHVPGRPIDFKDRARQLLVAASPNDRLADTHWYRPAFDEFLVRKAIEIGVEYRDQIAIGEVEDDGESWSMIIKRRDLHLPPGASDSSGAEREAVRIKASFLIDATGPAGFAPLNLASAHFPAIPRTSAIYAHFRNVRRLDEIHIERPDGAVPYPPDDAAVHHVFEGGWVWVLRFNNGITSAGAALSEVFQHGLPANAEPAQVWAFLLHRFPTLAQIFDGATLGTSFYSAAQLSFRRARAAGPNWALLPSSAGFVDPLLSTGFALTLLGIGRLGKQFQDNSFAPRDYEIQTFAELDATADLVSALYAKMSLPSEFNLLSLLYFAAMSFTETAWRLGREEMAKGFLLSNDRQFSAMRARLCATAKAGGSITEDVLGAAIEPYDVAGLTDWSRRNWYGVDLAELRRNAHKLRTDEASVERLIAKMAL
jgi:FADH2 O2-dependent halogenase